MLKVPLGELQKEALLEIIKKLNSIPIEEDEDEKMTMMEEEGDLDDVIDLGELLDESDQGPLAKLLALKKPDKGIELKESAVKVLGKKEDDEEDKYA